MIKKYRYYNIQIYRHGSNPTYYGIYFFKNKGLVNWYINSKGDPDKIILSAINTSYYKETFSYIESNLNPEIFMEILVAKLNKLKES